MTRSTLLLCPLLAALSVAGAASAQTAPAAPPPPPAKGPATALALEAAQTALATCAANGFKVSVSVVDSAGVLKVLLAGDGVRAMGVTSSTKKATTSVAFKAPTAAIAEQAKTDTALAAKLAADTTLFARAGGQPLMSGGELIGAIGVGGAPGGEKDDVCALAGVAKIKDRL
jgi:uncharacterized protein GlcG (DUF336 family)